MFGPLNQIKQFFSPEFSYGLSFPSLIPVILEVFPLEDFAMEVLVERKNYHTQAHLQHIGFAQYTPN